MNRIVILAAMLGFSAAPLSAATYKIDPVHSSVTFRIHHIVSKVTGRFEKVDGEFSYEEGKPAAWSAEAAIDAASINTRVAKRDDHLRSAEFFDVAKCPTIAFKSSKVSGVKDGSFKLAGELTMHCVTRPVTLDVEFGGVVKDPWGAMRAGAVATGKVNRKDFGIVWNKTLDNGGLMLGDDVEIVLEVEGTEVKK